jgi:hypothetical protein
MSTNDGGPAFPVECSYSGDGKLVGAQTNIASGWETGMTLRDFFAAQALKSGLVSSYSKCEHSEAYVARDCYKMADAMLRARSVSSPEGGK